MGRRDDEAARIRAEGANLPSMGPAREDLPDPLAAPPEDPRCDQCRKRVKPEDMHYAKKARKILHLDCWIKLGKPK